ncbi:ABC transporter permease [Leucobacter coleopterorum]|uniref:ABC transporter permease n=1 Tax=Leucobacter coleopterorum TaxID=2714933 RepID=A0ABX6JYS3_9MICO|nr:ABC transporter permease [Leucobacter coleopterorum]QIM18112.1 ABC transporter permease [Leucobacter coleopterorum]
MYGTYLRRELIGRRKQTIIVAIGLAIAVALVIVVNALSAGVRAAQEESLQSVYGVGTDLTVTGAAAEPGQGGGPRFQFGSGDGQTSDGTTTLSQSRLMADPRRGTLESSSLKTVKSLDGVADAAGALSLTNSTFSGQIPDQSATTDQGGGTIQGGDGQRGAPPQGGPGGGEFGIDSMTVMGVGLDNSEVGPLSAVTVDDGRALKASDAGTKVALLDSTYAKNEDIAVGGSVEIGGESFEVVGLVSSSTSSADTASDTYIPLDVAQDLSGAGDVVSTVYVQAASADDISAVQSKIETALPDATVSSQEELAAQVSGSVNSTVGLITSLGTWLSVIALAVAVLLAALFTLSGVSRRTREFGTLKAIGWSNRRIVGQVAGESMVQAALGGVFGIAIGGLAVWILNVVSPTISSAASSASAGAGSGGGPGGGMGPGSGGSGGAAQAADIVLNAPLTPWILLAALGLAIAGGLIAGALGGVRASRLSPAEALRSVN